MSPPQCDLCGDRPASVHFTEVEGDQIAKLFICTDCARQKGLFDDDANDLDEMVGVDELISTISKIGDPSAGSLQCPDCGLKYEEFESSGLLGCPECYVAFEKPLRPLLASFHAHPHHGRITGVEPNEDAAASLAALETQLKEAVAKEDFEAAARIRDEIRKLGESHAADDPGEGSSGDERDEDDDQP